ncbi:MAG: chromate transporter [Burkholderiaceae bacterium]|nr:chromate transporter [Burkholderiaceae bacterium]
MTSLNIAQWLELLTNFFILSLLSFGGAITVAPDMHRLLVQDHSFLNDVQFSASIAIAQAAPGPNVLFVAVLGYQAAGLSGMAATLLGIMLPSSLLALMACRFSSARINGSASWRGIEAFKIGMAPITIGLIASTGWILTVNVPGGPRWAYILLTFLSAVLVWRTRLHLLILISLGAIVGALGWV